MKNKKTFLILLLFIILCVIGIGIYEAYNSRPANNSSSNVNSHGSSTVSSNGDSKQIDNNGEAVNGAAQNQSPSETLNDLKKAQVNVTDKLGSSILFSSGKAGTDGSWTVENVKTNNVIMQCEVYLDNNLIARSVPIRPDQHIDKITLMNDVKAGTYDVDAYINYFTLDTNEYISKAGFKVKLTVQ